MAALYGLDGRSDVQVLTPMHKGRGGTEALNESLQDKHSKDAPQIEVASARGQVLRRFRVGVRVMQMKNDYGKNVFNGDVGVVASVDPEIGEVVVGRPTGDRASLSNVDGDAVRLRFRDQVA